MFSLILYSFCLYWTLLEFFYINSVLRGFQPLSVVVRYLDILLLTQDMHFLYYKTFNPGFFLIITQCLKGVKATVQFMPVVLNKARYITLLWGDVLQIVIMQDVLEGGMDYFPVLHVDICCFLVHNS